MRSCYCGANEKTQLCEDIQLVLPDECKLEPHVRVVQCPCGFVFSDTNMTQKDYDDYYSSQDFYSEPHKNFTKYITDIYDFCKEYIGSSVLDVGCGGGLLLRYLRTKGLKVRGIDTSQACVGALLTDGIDCTHGSIFTVSPEKYDFVFCCHVLEHIIDLNVFVHKLVSFVGNYLYIEVPDSSTYPTDVPFNDFNTEHVNHFTSGSLIRLFETNGMRCVKSYSEKNIPGNYVGLCFIFAKETNGLNNYISESRRKFISFIEAAPKKEPLCLYGAGQFAYKLLPHLPNVKYLVDDTKCRQGKMLGGIKIIDKPPDGVIVIKTF